MKKFYAEVGKKEGTPHVKCSLCVIRLGLNRNFKEVLRIDIIKDKEFNEANRVSDEAQCVELKKQGLAKTEHKPPAKAVFSTQKTLLLYRTRCSLR